MDQNSSTSQVPHILIVDDDEVIRLACLRTLQPLGLAIDVAENGRIGLEKIKSNKYDLVLLDLMMPEMSGTEFLDAIREIDANIIVVVITGFATIESAVETLKKGVYDYLSKPFTPEELRNVVRRGLERRALLLRAERLRVGREKSLYKLAAQKSRMTTIINCMGEGLIAVDKDGRLLLINAVACRLLGLATPCKTNTPIQGKLNSPVLENLIFEALQSEDFNVQQFVTREIVVDQAESRTFFVTLAPIREKRAELSGVALVLRDISEEKKLERMKAEFQKLVSVVAHELKAPISTIEGYLDIIIKGFVKDRPDKQMEYLVRSRDKAETLRNLIQDLLSLTSIESGRLTQEMTPVDVRKLITEIGAFMENEAQKKRLIIRYEIPQQFPVIMGDKNALTYLFSNLMSNAIKYNKEGGAITIKGEVQDKYVVISFIDTGYGIAEEELDKIFQEFYRSKSEVIQKIPGTGLGLNITKRIAELHNGFIKVKSKLNEGSQFDVYLPI
ncbi:MAG: response regulator [candidate division KSB1 bacterium]|nr:response regulator [candidate division KSB1 bacterium]MDZ7318309.1 response regulator [candidate division KSB1 bacterium]MDZ7340726.1 response regulator [candidate division KSB1 bacterium]